MCELSLKFICKKVKFSSCDYCNNIRDYEWTFILIIQNILYDVQTEVKGEIYTA